MYFKPHRCRAGAGTATRSASRSSTLCAVTASRRATAPVNSRPFYPSHPYITGPLVPLILHYTPPYNTLHAPNTLVHDCTHPHTLHYKRCLTVLHALYPRHYAPPRHQGGPPPRYITGPLVLYYRPSCPSHPTLHALVQYITRPRRPVARQYTPSYPTLHDITRPVSSTLCAATASRRATAPVHYRPAHPLLQALLSLSSYISRPRTIHYTP